MHKLLTLIIVAAIVVVFVAYLFLQKGEPSVVADCIKLCKMAKERRIDLSRGPCLSDLFSKEWKHQGWVCDVAHSPRLPIDNLPENQCSEWGKTAHSFVEVDEECRVIRVFRG